tara:strand:- start:1147 stop:1494 length:348 start_codon:yes stop_codon:yes gene_type:complete
MPSYLFENPETGETKEIIQRISEKHVFFDEKGLQWNRVFLPFNVSINARPIDPFSKKDFLKKTEDKNVTMGELWDVSAEASEKRKQVDGEDHVKEKFFKNYTQKRAGTKHPDAGK